MRVCAGLVAAAVTFTRGGQCRAQAAEYELAYSADTTCPDQQQFEGLVSYYLEGEAPAPGAHAQVSLHEDEAGAKGSMMLERADGSRYTRELSAATCQEVAPALAFVLAYALAGRDSESALPSALPGEAAPGEQAPTKRAIAMTPTQPALPTADRKPARPARSSWRLGLGVALGARTGLGPIWTPVEAARVDARRERPRDPLVLAVMASVLRDETITRIDRNGTTSFAWLAGRLDFCPLRLELMSDLGVLPCAGTHVGRLVVTGEPVPRSGARGRSASKLWADAALATRLELRMWRVLALETQAELLFPLTPYRFAFDNPDTPVYQVPSLAGAAFVGLGVQFL